MYSKYTFYNLYTQMVQIKMAMDAELPFNTLKCRAI